MTEKKKETTDREVSTVYSKLRAVQNALKVEKAEEGRFGKHRTVEGILQKAKPLLDKHGLFVVMDSEIITVNGKNYVNVTATVFDGTGDSFSVKAQAYEGEISRGLDAPQVTGSATSYARKYALSGLLALDDGKDDPDSYKDDPTEPTKPKIATGPEKFKLQQMMKDKGIDEADQMTLFVNSIIGKDRVETHDEFVEVYHALNDDDDSASEPATKPDDPPADQAAVGEGAGQ